MQQTNISPIKASTAAHYRVNYERLLKRSQMLSQTSLNEDEFATVSIEQVITDWLASQSRSTPGAVNVQRNALLWVLKTDRPNGWEAHYLRVKESRRMGRVNTSAGDQDADTTVDYSRKRVRGRVIPEADLQTLVNKLVNSSLEWSHKTQWFLLSGVASGARPIEWIQAHWCDEDKTILRIYTAKGKRSNALERAGVKNITEGTLKTDEISFRDVPIEPMYQVFVQMHINAVSDAIRDAQLTDPRISSESAFKKYYEKARHCLWRTCCTVFSGDSERLYSFADARQTFSANNKATLGNEAAAKALGHTLTMTREYYAPAREAWGRYKKSGSTPSTKDAQSEQNVTNDGQASLIVFSNMETPTEPAILGTNPATV